MIYQGRPGGILWVDPELGRATGIDREDVPARYVAAHRGRHRVRVPRGGERLHRRTSSADIEELERGDEPHDHDDPARHDDLHDRGHDHHPGQLMLRAVRRNTELGLIVLGTLVTVGAYVLASLAEDATIPADIVPFLGRRARAPARRPRRHPPPGAERRRHAAADRRAAERARLRVHRPARRGQGRPEEPGRAAVGVGGGRHRRVHRHAAAGPPGPRPRARTAGRSGSSASPSSCSRSCPASAGSTSAPGSG